MDFPKKNLKVLMIGTDRNLFRLNSPSRMRLVDYGSVFEELHVVVFSLKSLGFKKEQIAPNVWIYPTNSISRLFYVRDGKKICSKIIKERKFSAPFSFVTSQDPFETGLVGKYLKNKFKLSFVVQIHTDIFSPYFKKLSLLNMMRIFIAPKIIYKADHFRVVSEKIKKGLESVYKINSKFISVLPVFVDINSIVNKTAGIDLHKKYPQFKKIILMVSRLTYEKNVSFALDVFAKLLINFKDAGLVIVGDGLEKDALLLKSQYLKISKSVIFEGWQDNAKDYYKSADVFLSTSFFEGFGMAMLEAASVGCPVVSSDVGIASELYLENKKNCVFSIDQKDLFVESIKKLFFDENFYQKASEEIKKESEKFKITKEVYLNKYREMFVK